MLRGQCAIAIGLLVAMNVPVLAQTGRESNAAYSPRIAVMPLGDLDGLRPDVAGVLASAGMTVVASGLTDAAASGVGYQGSLNPTADEVRRLAAAIGCEVLAMGASSLVERESTDPRQRWDGIVALFLVDGRSGRLIRYRAIPLHGPEREIVRRDLFSAAALEVSTWIERVPPADARTLNPSGPVAVVPMLDFVRQPEGTAENIPPRFFKRPVPAYTPDADRLHVTATVELLVEFLADGSYGRIEVVRWAGFGLDESAIETVRNSTFWPARRNGASQAARALLRFNFTFRAQLPDS